MESEGSGLWFLAWGRAALAGLLLLVVALLGQAGCNSSDPAQASRLKGKTVAGFSMGAMGATFLGLEHPERFDAIGALGGPMDFTWLLSYMERAHLGGFCSLDELEALLADDPDHPAVLDDPAMLPCMKPAADHKLERLS